MRLSEYIISDSTLNSQVGTNAYDNETNADIQAALEKGAPLTQKQTYPENVQRQEVIELNGNEQTIQK